MTGVADSNIEFNLEMADECVHQLSLHLPCILIDSQPIKSNENLTNYGFQSLNSLIPLDWMPVLHENAKTRYGTCAWCYANRNS